MIKIIMGITLGWVDDSEWVYKRNLGTGYNLHLSVAIGCTGVHFVKIHLVEC